MNSHIVKISVIGFLGGIVCGSLIDTAGGPLFIIMSWSIFFCFVVHKNVKIFLIFLGLTLFICGMLRLEYAYPTIEVNSVHFYQDEHKYRTVRGYIVEDPDRRQIKVNYIIEVSEILLETESKNINGRILISSQLYPEYDYGDKIEISGNITKPYDFESFSYSNYLSLFDVYSVMNRPRINLISKGHGFLLYEKLFWVKRVFEEQLNKLFPEPMASFEAGLLTGSRKGIPEELMNNFNITGLTHIIAISGYNISLIIVLVSSLLDSMARRIKIPIIITFIILFTMFVGASAAVVRAAIMGVISVFALWFGRQSQIINALLLSAFFMALFKPQTLLFDVGFQLSFLATLGLIVTGSFFQRHFSFMPKTFGIQEAIAMTLSAQVFALPVILMNFGRFSLISPVANVLIAPFIPFAMLFGFISAVLSFFVFELGFIFMFPGWLFLKVIILVTNFLAAMPLASFEIPWFSMFYLLGYYLIFILGRILYRLWQINKRKLTT